MNSSDEVDNAVGEAVATNKQLLAEKRKALEEAVGRHRIAKEYRDESEMGKESGIIDALRSIIAEIETELLGEREVVGVRKAKERLLGIKRAAGSVVVSIDVDEQRVLAAVAAVADAITTLNNRYSQIVQLRAEAAALSDRFSLPKPALPDVEAPARRDLALVLTQLPNTLLANAWRNEPTEDCEFKMRTRRTYAECNGTPGAEIIAAAGLKPFPELIQRQKEIIAAKAREKEAALRVMAGLPKIPAQGNVPLGTL